MTDKQIIIDGVDVSRCTHFDMNFKHCDILGRLCREHNNCYYKQLKRTMNQIVELNKKVKAKEQECEGLRYEIGSLENDRDILQQQLDQLKAENKHLNDLLNQALKDYEKTRETLTEIKEIAEKRNYLDYNECLDDILQKISEVVDG